ncbi:MAG TPA: sugar phosphate nucleotidyltransferase [Acidobacteriota bacterium]|nr:sugar phosphate nucleotidyltransferase [Acidobacteriota bacterium]
MTHPVRKAFVLGAGLGTRLRPLTDVLPKPLLPIFGKQLVTFAIDHLRQIGIEKIWVNTHHLYQRFAVLASDQRYNAVEFVFEPEILETGGGIKNLQRRIGDETFIVYSGDILTDVPVEHLLEAHLTQRNDVTLALRSTGLSSAVRWCSDSGRILDLYGDSRSGPARGYDFAGISIWNPSVFARIPENTKISFVPVLADWLKAGGKIGGFLLEENQWFNVGTRVEYLRLHQFIATQRWLPRYFRSSGTEWPVRVEPSAKVSANSRIEGVSYVGNNCSIDRDVSIEDSILLPGSSLASGVSMRSCIVAGIEVPAGNYVGMDFI